MTDENGNSVDKTYSLLHKEKRNKGQQDLDDFNDIEEDIENGKRVVINEQTMIGGTAWSNLKKFAMQSDYTTSFWFKKLDSEGIQILDGCILA